MRKTGSFSVNNTSNNKGPFGSAATGASKWSTSTRPGGVIGAQPVNMNNRGRKSSIVANMANVPLALRRLNSINNVKVHPAESSNIISEEADGVDVTARYSVDAAPGGMRRRPSDTQNISGASRRASVAINLPNRRSSTYSVRSMRATGDSSSLFNADEGSVMGNTAIGNSSVFDPFSGEQDETLIKLKLADDAISRRKSAIAEIQKHPGVLLYSQLIYNHSKTFLLFRMFHSDLFSEKRIYISS
jgi:hypothetical protein